MDKSWRVILAFVGIFMAGTVTGGLIALRMAPSLREQRLPSVLRPSAMSTPRPFQPQFLRRMAEQLDLTAEQKESIKPIETRTIEELRRLRRETQHDTELIIERAQDEIRALLTPVQQGKFDESIAKARERVRKFIEQEGRKRREGSPADRPRDGSTAPK